jgi:hypothetical protein
VVVGANARFIGKAPILQWHIPTAMPFEFKGPDSTPRWLRCGHYFIYDLKME